MENSHRILSWKTRRKAFTVYPGWLYSASGLAAVWARDNTREEIFAAFKRREVYATSGPRIRVRFFAGYGFTQDDLDRRDIAAAGYRKGVPMGSDLGPADRAPGFLIHAVKDPNGANLDRVQVVKSWLDPDGQSPGKGLRRGLVRCAGHRDPDGKTATRG